jgi:hypothetical protein
MRKWLRFFTISAALIMVTLAFVQAATPPVMVNVTETFQLSDGATVLPPVMVSVSEIIQVSDSLS